MVKKQHILCEYLFVINIFLTHVMHMCNVLNEYYIFARETTFATDLCFCIPKPSDGSKFFLLRIAPFTEGFVGTHGSIFFPLRVDPFSEGTGFARVASLESVSILLKLNGGRESNMHPSNQSGSSIIQTIATDKATFIN